MLSVQSLGRRLGAAARPSSLSSVLPSGVGQELVPTLKVGAAAEQVRWTTRQVNKTSLLQQYYRRMPIRKKFRRAIIRGTMIMCEKTGQVKIPPIGMSGYDDKKNPYRGKFEDLRSTRVWFKN
eukprot:CAMPEP_0206449514 /NCGR_PEP_ID=MMETSP0324_2-20121206/18136_1 /ASSEMBLY_ACC=CAM_ASM_000836 /TAXON_ID=2866 /ORGANISM="Crypthecodinium cohnii, Strain Seligo" /LENGTH=122 /DNA_ID=CAMNT_0053918909 /DNA_START=46 /DNA_END=414 /DNA_ORIENTATION=-